MDRFYHGDWLGSTRYLSDSTGNNFPSALRFDGYGNRSATAGPDYPTDRQYAGAWGCQTEHQTGSEPGLGLQYLHHRYYDPAIGRFISPDPIGFEGGPNLYAYVEGNPVGAVDPSGLVSLDAIREAPGRLWNRFRKKYFGVTLRKGAPTLQNVNLEAYPWLPGAGRKMSAGIDQVEQKIATEAFWGVAGVYLAKRGACSSQPQSAAGATQLKTHLRLLDEYGQGGHRALQNGRIRYYGILDPARKAGPMAGRRLVREWSPATGAMRTWHETLDHAGRVRIVRPVTDGPKVHYMFDEGGKFVGTF